MPIGERILGSTTCSAHVCLLVFGFGFGMIVHELFLEALFRLPDVPQTMALWSTAFQFSACAALPALLQIVGLDAPRGKGIPSRIAAEPPSSPAAGLKRWTPYLILSVVMFASSAAANHAVHYVDYTVKVVAKASKLLPTMAVAPLLSNSPSFSISEYIAASLLCVGTAAFSYNNQSHSSSAPQASTHHVLLGLVLLSFAVLVDGSVPNVQQWLMRRGDSANSLMMRSNVIGAVGGFVGLIASGNVQLMLAYSARFPSVWSLLSAVGIALAISVWCYVRLIDEAGATFAVGVSTLRKTMTIALSYMIFPGKMFTLLRAFALIMVFVGMALGDYLQKTKKQNPKSPPHGPLDEIELQASQITAPAFGRSGEVGMRNAVDDKQDLV